MLKTNEDFEELISIQLAEIDEAQAIIDEATLRIEVAIEKLKEIYYL